MKKPVLFSRLDLAEKNILNSAIDLKGGVYMEAKELVNIDVNEMIEVIDDVVSEDALTKGICDEV